MRHLMPRQHGRTVLRRFFEVADRMGRARPFPRLWSAGRNSGLPRWRRLLALLAVLLRIPWLMSGGRSPRPADRQTWVESANEIDVRGR